MVFGGDNSGWMGIGGVPQTMDNLIGTGALEPTVVVSINNSRHGINFINTPNARLDLINYIMPFVEENFNVSNNPQQRAVAGLSLGGAWVGQLMTHHANEFNYFGIFSAPNGPMNGALGVVDTNELANSTVMLGYGIFARNDYALVPEMLSSRNIEFSERSVPGGHDNHAWAQQFSIFASEYLWTSHLVEIP